jgi:hypothetical protein
LIKIEKFEDTNQKRQTTQWPNEKRQKDKTSRSSSTCSTHRATLVTNPVLQIYLSKENLIQPIAHQLYQ